MTEHEPPTTQEPSGLSHANPQEVLDRGDDTLAIVALALGIAALVMSFIPFYGMGMAIPLGIVALVLGLLARSRRSSGQGMAAVGAVTGGLALVVTVAMVLAMFFPFWGFSREASISVTATEAVEIPLVDVVEYPEATPDPDAPPSRAAVEPGPSDPTLDALSDASGTAELTIAGDRAVLDLTECTIGGRHGGFLRGSGPAGRILLRAGGTHGSAFDVLLVVEPDGEQVRVFVGAQRGSSVRERSTMTDRRRLELTGRLRDALDDEAHEIHLVADCR
jgi:hypothetical protein